MHRCLMKQLLQQKPWAFVTGKCVPNCKINIKTDWKIGKNTSHKTGTLGFSNAINYMYSVMTWCDPFLSLSSLEYPLFQTEPSI